LPAAAAFVAVAAALPAPLAPLPTAPVPDPTALPPLPVALPAALVVEPLAVPVALPLPLALLVPVVTTTVAFPNTVLELVAIALVLIGLVIPCVVIIPVKPALYDAHSAEPMDAIAPMAEAGQDARRQGAARAPIEACVGPQAQAWSVGPQPAAVMALERQAVAQGGSAPRFWAVVRVRRAKESSWYFMIAMVVECE
jgi:hypothetical protein